MARFAVLADDLTGAMDTGVRMLAAGLGVGVSIDGRGIAGLAASVDLLVVDTETRNRSPAEAAAAVAEAIRTLQALAIEIVYKKIDSTLRGNLGAELEAVLDAGGARAVLVAPALPAQGRVLRHGVLLVQGVPLAETEFAADPFSPAGDSVATRAIARQSQTGVHALELSVVRSGRLLERMRDLVDQGVRIMVADAETERDLQAIARAAEQLSGVLPCGSAGLFERMSLCESGRRRARGGGPGSAAGRVPGANGSPVLAISGSPSLVSKRQIEQAAADPRNLVLALDGRSEADEMRAREVERVAVAAAAGLAAGRNVIVDAAAAGKAEIARLRGGDSLAVREESARIQEALAAVVLSVFEAARPGGLVLFGGDTAAQVCGVLGMVGIRITGEVEPFVPVGTGLGGRWEGLSLVTKAGGFGSPGLLLEAFRLLRGE